jgi:hypothetical protein
LLQRAEFCDGVNWMRHCQTVHVVSLHICEVYKHTCSCKLQLSLSLSVCLSLSLSPMSSWSPTLHLYTTPDIHPTIHPRPQPLVTSHFPNPTSTRYERRGGEGQRGWKPPQNHSHPCSRIVKRDREKEVWGKYVSIKIKCCREDKQRVSLPSVHDFHKRTRKQERLLEGFAFGVRLHSSLLLVRERQI